MQDFTSHAATRMTELTKTISDNLEELSKLVVATAHEADARFTDLFNRQCSLPSGLRMPPSVSSVGKHIRIRSTTVGQMMEVLANVQYIRDRELITGTTLPWKELIREGKIDEAAKVMRQYEELTSQEIMAIIGFFSSVGAVGK